MKIYVVQEHINGGDVVCAQHVEYKDSCNVINKSFTLFEEAYNYARQKAFELMRDGWLDKYIETKRAIYINTSGLTRADYKHVTYLWAVYSIHEIDVNL